MLSLNRLSIRQLRKGSFLNSIGTLSRMRLDMLGTMCQCTFLVGEETFNLALVEYDILKKNYPVTPRFYRDQQFILRYIVVDTSFQ